MLCILSFLGAEDITSEQLWHTVIRGGVYNVFLSTDGCSCQHFIIAFLKTFQTSIYRQLCLTWYSHANYTCKIHVENHLTWNSRRGRFTWILHETQLAMNMYILLVFNDFFQECVFSNVIDYRYAFHRVRIRIYHIIWQYLTKCI